MESRTPVRTSGVRLERAAARPVKGTATWRCNFDLLSDGGEPMDLRCFLRDGFGALTETWLYQRTPPA
ncbi:glucan biosynthesis protein [Methylococcus geothermalis]|uniref:glucan biosynthesis protein n=1 Tax=Methylococcus geothermalis TaxID=2681310 RepID=UPI0038995196